MIRNVLASVIIVICNWAATCFASTSDKQIFMQTDRNCYISGDNILFSIIFPQNQGTDTVDGSDVSIDIATIEGVWVTGTVAMQTQGFATGIINIPDSLSTGYYQIRAYTNYPNIDNYYCIREILITNRFGKTQNKTLCFSNIKEEKHIKQDIIEISKNDYTTKENVQLTFNTTETLNSTIRVINKTQWNSQLEPIIGKCEPFSINEGYNPITPYKGILITGIVTDSATNKPIKDAVVFISLEDSTVRLRYDITDEKGEFCILLNNYFGMQEIFACAFNNKIEPYYNARIKLHNRFDRIRYNTELTEAFPETDSTELNKATIAKAFDIQPFAPQEKVQRPTVNYDQYVIGTPTHTAKTEDYVSFQDFNEIAREILPLIRIRKNKSDEPEMRIITDLELKKTVNANPFILVDGVPLSKLNPLLKCNSDMIKQVDTQNKPRNYGNIVFENGIVLVWTNKLDFWTKQNIPGTYKFWVHSFQPPIEISHDKQTPEDKLPDFRQTTYWNPQIIINSDSQIEFETSDEKGEFIIEIVGVNGNGEIFKDYKQINVN